MLVGVCDYRCYVGSAVAMSIVHTEGIVETTEE